MVTRPINKENFVEQLHNFIKQHNTDLGIRLGVPEEQVLAIMEDQERANKLLCGHIYDFMVLEGYVER